MKRSLYVAILIITVLVLASLTFADATRIFTGKEDHSITRNEAVQYIARFRQQVKEDYPLGGFFGSDAIVKILSQEDCVGMRFYYGMNKEGDPVLVLVGVDTKGNDMVDGELAERNYMCPPFCDDALLLSNFIAKN